MKNESVQFDFSEDSKVETEAEEAIESEGKKDLENVKSSEDNTKAKNTNSDKDIAETDVEKLKQQLSGLSKQQEDTQNWGRQQRAAYVLTKKRIEALSQKMFEDGTLLEEQLSEIKNAFNTSFSAGEIDAPREDNPYTNIVKNLEDTLEEYKKWNTDKDADAKFQSFFKHLELVAPQKLQDIREYLSTEEPKEALKYILENGDKYYNKFYKHAVEKGDAFSYIEELTNKNEVLTQKVKELTEELDQTEGKVYTKSIKSRGTQINSVKNSFDFDKYF